jgi:predicted glutamine amidotransferase
MCKILIIPSVKEETNDLAWRIAKEMGRLMSKGNSDGLGYAAVSGDGNMFGERWLKNTDAFKERIELTEFDQVVIDEYGGFLHKDERYNKFGSVSDSNVRAIILHARLATSGKQFYNTHPFVDADTALIHNGVITNIGNEDLKTSTCDSEKILNEYVKYKVNNNPKNITKVASNLLGYYACAVLSRMKDGTPILDVFKDDAASLNAAWVRELGGIVITTAMTDLVEVASTNALHLDSMYEVKSGVLMRFNALTGKVIGATKFKPKGFGEAHANRRKFSDWYEESGDWRENGHLSYQDLYNRDHSTNRNNNAYSNKPEVLPAVIVDRKEPLSMAAADRDGWEWNNHTKTWRRVQGRVG